MAGRDGSMSQTRVNKEMRTNASHWTAQALQTQLTASALLSTGREETEHLGLTIVKAVFQIVSDCEP